MSAFQILLQGTVTLLTDSCTNYRTGRQ